MATKIGTGEFNGMHGRVFPRVRGWMLAAAALVVLVLGLAATAAGAATAGGAQADYELRAMRKMIELQRETGGMALVCQIQAPHSELKGLCGQILVDQADWSNHMRFWMLYWHDRSMAEQEAEPVARLDPKLAVRKGKQFEIELTRRLILNQMEAARRSQTCVIQAGHDELRLLCQQMQARQSGQVQQMQLWLCEWYGICGKEDLS